MLLCVDFISKETARAYMQASQALVKKFSAKNRGQSNIQ
jgi:hypothetical protein